jgi:hypothetical protein
MWMVVLRRLGKIPLAARAASQLASWDVVEKMIRLIMAMSRRCGFSRRLFSTQTSSALSGPMVVM